MVSDRVFECPEPKVDEEASVHDDRVYKDGNGHRVGEHAPAGKVVSKHKQDGTQVVDTNETGERCNEASHDLSPDW